jgi:hypothetical protein
MLVKNTNRKFAHSRIAYVALALAIFGSACGTTAAHPTSVGASSLDYSTAQHMGRLEVGAGASSLDYDTARHLGRLKTGAGATSLDYDTARHLGLPGAGVTAP